MIVEDLQLTNQFDLLVVVDQSKTLAILLWKTCQTHHYFLGYYILYHIYVGNFFGKNSRQIHHRGTEYRYYKSAVGYLRLKKKIVEE